jgi:hypothetical protein
MDETVAIMAKMAATPHKPYVLVPKKKRKTERTVKLAVVKA